ncbi:MAG TPA: hypothetical protein VNW47_03715 [Terriglobales bacterium]|jgi:hypothetical protein|nr:hypothetical protein [Terriglobales bacterium]
MILWSNTGSTDKLVVARRAVVLVIVLACCVAARRAWLWGGRRKTQGIVNTYSTRFDHDEDPLSESGKWSNGKATGLDWSDVSTFSGLAFGTESGKDGYDDSTAILTGTWLPNQTAEATVHSVNQNDRIYEEVELRLRSSMSPHWSTGYEINFRCSTGTGAYSEIVRWDGPVGKFTYLATQWGRQFRIGQGDVVKASVVKNVITAYVNGTQVLEATDNTFSSGNPGIGFFLQGASGVTRDYGFTSFTASDGLSNWDAVKAITVGTYERILEQSKRVGRELVGR